MGGVPAGYVEHDQLYRELTGVKNMKQIAMIFFACAVAGLAQTGRITGTVTDDSGTPIVGALVMASLRSSPAPLTLVPGRPPFFMPVMANAAAGPKGEFQIDGLLVGTYAVCVENPERAFLNPCLWTDKPVTVDLAAGAAVSGVSVVAPKGVIVTVRVQDSQGLLAANPANDDVRIGTYHGKSPFIPARVSSRNATGKTMSLAVPGGQSMIVAVSSTTFALADNTGKAFGPGEIQIPVPSTAVVAAASASARPW
jgi:hypothetical protein